MAFVGRAVEDPEIIARLAAILASDWAPAGVVRDALHAAPTFYHDQAVVVAGMLSADAHENRSAARHRGGAVASGAAAVT